MRSALFRAPPSGIWISLFGLTLVGGAPGRAAPDSAVPEPPPLLAAPVHPGQTQAQVTCATCHRVPEPGQLTRKIWDEFALKKMSFYTGINQLDPEQNEEADLYLASGLFPPRPILTRESWDAITNYFLTVAPVDRIPHGPRPKITVGLRHFAVEKPRFRRDPPLTTLTTIDTKIRKIYAADANAQELDVLEADGRQLTSVFVGNIPVWLQETPEGFYLACIGHFFPKEERRGQIILLERTPRGLERKVLFSNLPRPCHIEVADLNQDGRPDLLVSMFGYLTGRLSWYERREEGQWLERILYPKAGPLVCVVHDFNGDGAPDIATLTGQESESLLIYYNDGQGGFEPPHTVFQKPPSYGHTFMEGVDFNQDGKLDLLVCNGDNGDYESPPKPYHGIRLLLNRDGRHFEEAFFLPLHGVFRALARDFDGDGDLDIAAISFYPDYEKTPQESFVYFENLGDYQFQASTFRECISGRWMTLDAGDLDGDGDLDLVLGSLIRMPGEVPSFVRDIWESVGPSVLILKNTLRSPGAEPAAPN